MAFSQIPMQRTCQDAWIEPHWCSCLEWQEIAVMDRVAVAAAKEAVAYMNVVTTPFRQHCRVLQLHTMVRAGKFVPNKGKSIAIG